MVLQTFHRISGLKVNPSKSDLLFLHTPVQVQQSISTHLGCNITDFPTKYLGLPLSYRKPKFQDFQPLLQKFSNRLTGWAASVLSQAGRIVLINACLTALPVYYMSAFQLPTKLLNQIDKIRRDFFWHGASLQGKQIHMTAWSDICKPIKLGGLGIKNLHVFNTSLLAKWLYKWTVSQTSLLQTLWMSLQNHNFTPIPLCSTLYNSFQKILPILQVNTTFPHSQQGQILLWYHNWGNGVLMHNFNLLFQASINPNISLQQALTSLADGNLIASFDPAFHSNTSFLDQLTCLQDLLHNCTINSTTGTDMEMPYCHLTKNCSLAKGTYNFITLQPKIFSRLHKLTKLKLPPRVRLFLWKMLSNKLPTLDNLQGRGWILPNFCVLCKSDGESVTHIFTECQFLQAMLLYGHPNSLQHVRLLMENVWSSNSINRKMKEELAFALFYLWKERCDRTFTPKLSSPLSVATIARIKYIAWSRLHFQD